MLRIFATPNVEPAIAAFRSFDSCHAQRYPPVIVRAAEAAAVSPRGILMIIVGPGDGPVVATGRAPIVSRPIDGDPGNDRAGWVRRRCWPRATRRSRRR